MLHITIVRDGKTELDLDTSVIIAAIDAGKKGTQNFVCFDHASSVDIAASIASVLWKIKKLGDNYSLERQMAEFVIQARELGEEGVTDD